MIRIICIVGDGRSGSTLLDSILSNILGSTSVGECSRYWTRWIEGESYCGCDEKITVCPMWSKITQKLQESLPSYKHDQFFKELQEIQYFKNFKKIKNLNKTKEGKAFLNVIASLYHHISEISGSKIIIDSSKSISWARLLQQIQNVDVKVLHLERSLVEVANSWKKEIILPEYKDKRVFMPKKSNFLIIKTWLKVKLLSRYLKGESYFFVLYSDLQNDSEKEVERILEYLEVTIQKPWVFLPGHFIGGNPMRYSNKGEIRVSNKQDRLRNLNHLERIMFKFVHLVVEFIFHKRRNTPR